MKLYKNKNWLYQKHWLERYNTYEMARLADCTKTTISRWMNKLGIPTRTSSEARVNFYEKGGKHPMLGKPRTKKTREKIRRARLGKHHTKKSRRKMSDARLTWHKTHPEALKGEKHPQWKGGRTIDSNGYMLIHAPDHPHAQINGYIGEHRLMMEEILGRYLLPEEIVHHEDEIKDNNEPGNLRLFSSNKEHLDYHRDLRRSAEARL